MTWSLFISPCTASPAKTSTNSLSTTLRLNQRFKSSPKTVPGMPCPLRVLRTNRFNISHPFKRKGWVSRYWMCRGTRIYSREWGCRIISTSVRWVVTTTQPRAHFWHWNTITQPVQIIWNWSNSRSLKRRAVTTVECRVWFSQFRRSMIMLRSSNKKDMFYNQRMMNNHILRWQDISFQRGIVLK